MSNGLEENYHHHQEEDNNVGNINVDKTEPVVDMEQLRLVQLCFGEHEFGIVIDNNLTDVDETNNNNNNTNNSDSSEDEGNVDKMELNFLSISKNNIGVIFDFDPFQFIQEKLNYGVPLISLCHDLEIYSTYLHNNILRYVNTDVHNAFVKVSSHLVGMQDELRCVKQPVITTIKKVEETLERLSQLEEVVNSQIEHATEVEVERLFDVSFLKLLLLYNLLYERIEIIPLCLRSIQNDYQHQQPFTQQSNSSLIDTITIAAGSTHVYESLCDIAATVQQLRSIYNTLPNFSKRIKEYEEASLYVQEGIHISHQVFANVFLALYDEYIHNSRYALRQNLLDVMRLYRIAGEVREFCQMFRERILRPLLDSVLSWRAATQAKHSLQDTILLLTNLREQLETNILCFLPLLHEAFEGTLLPIPMIIWPSICEALVKKMSSLYDISVATAFQKRYLAAHELLALMETHCTTKEELYALIQSPDVALWKHKWNTDVYSTVQTNEFSKRVTNAIESFITTSFKQLTEQQQKCQEEDQHMDVIKFNMKAFTLLREALDWLFLPDIYIYTVTPKFIREAAGGIRRMVQSVMEFIETEKSTNSMQDWLNVVINVSVDINMLAVYIEGPFRIRLEEASGQTFSITSPFIQLLSQEICRNSVTLLQRSLQAVVMEECLVGLQNIRLVRSAYSHMRKPFPTTASWYIQGIVEPLQRFDAAVRLVLPVVTHRTIMMELVEDIARRFCVIAKETLVTAKRTEESWEKLRRRKESIASGGRVLSTEGQSGNMPSTTPVNIRPTQETATDRDKMTLQLYLDAKTFVTEVEPLFQGSVKVELLPAVIALFKLLRRANWLLGEDISEPPDVDESDS